MADNVTSTVVEAFPWLKGVVDVARVTVSALPHYGGAIATTTFLILVVGGYYALRKTGVLRGIGGSRNDDKW